MQEIQTVDTVEDIRAYSTETIVEERLQEQNGTVNDGQLDDTDEL